MLSRRQVLATVGAAVGVSAVGSVRAADPTVTGQVVSEADVGLSGSRIEFYTVDRPFESWLCPLSKNGTFEQELRDSGEYEVVFFDIPDGERIHETPNQRPDIYDFGTIRVGSDWTDVGTLTLPAPEVVQIQCVTPDGAPIRNLPFNLRAHPSGSGLAPGAFRTNANGYVKYPGADHTGVEIAPSVRMEVQPPSQSSSPVRLGLIDSIDDGHRTVTVDRGDRFPGVIVNESVSAADADPVTAERTLAPDNATLGDPADRKPDSDSDPAVPKTTSDDSWLDTSPNSTVTVMTAAGVVLSAGTLLHRVLADE
ncbi:hypothetical protein [Halococcoides cellulosivorans]|uniref:Uncharacterized protein n=1 Tax=Halococcoides cellulosivorans TaxID=1679096 RepID=A0A2R4WZK4_9EURY|nr:hypothetical protein [Halococcoides cellulosivorans]AWB26970.1 hypothetical protein HARCEL1_04210 [Halococcoides cellulosivorans]